MGKSENVMKFVEDGAVIGGTAAVYVIGTNEALRRTSLGYGARAGVVAGGGVIGGMAVAKVAPRVGIGLVTGGLIGGAVNGINAYNLAKYRGQGMTDTRAALPGSAGQQQQQPPQQPANGFRQTNGLPPAAPTQQAIPPAPVPAVPAAVPFGFQRR